MSNPQTWSLLTMANETAAESQGNQSQLIWEEQCIVGKNINESVFYRFEISENFPHSCSHSMPQSNTISAQWLC